MRSLIIPRRLFSSQNTASRTPLLAIANANIYQFGSVKPIYKSPLNWTIAADGEAWAIVGDGKQTIFDVLRGKLRVSPSALGGLWPLFSETDSSRDPFSQIAYASFATRRQISGGGFYDFTARYGGVREEDKVTLRQSLESSLAGEDNALPVSTLNDLTDRLEISKFLDLPLIALSNGQTRRAHVVRQLLKGPKMLLLDEPLTGLDAHNRPLLLKILQELHSTAHPRVIMGLRTHDAVPEWITHVALAQGGTVNVGTKDAVLPPGGFIPDGATKSTGDRRATANEALATRENTIIVETKGLNVRYHERHVLREIDWTIRAGDRWHLQGANGSGKTTLLSMVTGDHPQSYLQPHFNLFGRPRRGTSTIQLQQQIGFVSPELFNAFPRRVGPSGLTVRDAIATGLQATFSYRPRSSEDNSRVDDILSKLGPERTWDPIIQNEEYGGRLFATLSMGEQSMVLLMRALVAKCKLVILDEAFAGMGDAMVETAKRYLREDLGDDQAAVFVTHWEQEVPWPNVKKLSLVDGRATES